MRIICTLLVTPLFLCAAACGDGGDNPEAAVGKSVEPLTLSQTLDGIQLTVTTSGPLIQGVNNTYTWTATNVSSGTLTGVGLGSNWANNDGSAPIIKVLGPGCNNQSANDIPPKAALGIWCGQLTGVSLAPGASVSGWATLEDTAVGPVKYNLYSVYTDPISGSPHFNLVSDTESAGPGPVDLQITGSSNNGSPPVGSNYVYTYNVKNAGPWIASGGVSFSDALPASLTFVGATTTAGTCTGGQTVTCALGNLANGAQATITITVAAPGTAQSIVNTASASLTAPQSDTNVNNNSVNVTVAPK